MRYRYRRIVVLFAAVFCLVTHFAYGQQTNNALPPLKRFQQKKEFVFKGRVERIDPIAKTIVVTSGRIPGWRPATTATYIVNNPEVFTDLEPGNHVMARVYEGDFKALYAVKVVPPDDIPVRFPKKPPQ